MLDSPEVIRRTHNGYNFHTTPPNPSSTPLRSLTSESSGRQCRSPHPPLTTSWISCPSTNHSSAHPSIYSPTSLPSSSLTTPSQLLTPASCSLSPFQKPSDYPNLIGTDSIGSPSHQAISAWAGVWAAQAKPSSATGKAEPLQWLHLLVILKAGV